MTSKRTSWERIEELLPLERISPRNRNVILSHPSTLIQNLIPMPRLSQMGIHPIASSLGPDEETDSKKLPWTEVKRHNSRESCWVVVDGCVYDVTSWMDNHPGGAIVLLNSSGRDATDIFNAYHSRESISNKLKFFYVGAISDYKVESTLESFRRFAKSVEGSDLMNTSIRFYAFKVISYILLLCLSIGLVYAYRDTFWIGTVCGGIAMAAFFQQVAFFGHDLGHTAVTHIRGVDLAIGLLFGNILSGVSLGWWKATHNTHHVLTNSVECDPDIQHLPFFAVTSRFLTSIYSKYHERFLRFNWLAQFLIPLQAKLYYVIMAFARCNLYIQSYLLLLQPDKEVRKRVKTHRYIEVVGLVLFAMWFGSLVSILPDIWHRCIFVLISHCLAGVLHVQITLSHFSMPVYTGDTLSTDSFVEHQLNTSLDIDCPSWLDWFHGGLQFQTAHHLFPRVPRHNLRRLRTLIMQFCLENGLKYNISGFVDANMRMLKHLQSVSDECRNRALRDIMSMRG